MRRARCLPMLPVALLAGAAGGCGHPPGRSATRTVQRGPRTTQLSAAQPTLRVFRRGRLPAAVQLPGLARTADGRVVAVGGLDARDSSTAGLVAVAPGAASTFGRLPVAAHDVAATAIGRTVYAFGGGTVAGPVATITAVDRSGRTTEIGRLPMPLSDATAVTLGGTAYVIGGYTGSTPLRSVLACRPGRGPRVAAALPHPVRYAAAAAIGRRIYVAGGTTGTHARRDIVEVDPATHRARVVGELPRPVAHAAGTALDGTFYVFGGRGDALTGQRAGIWAYDPAARSLRRAGRLPTALSDLAAVATRGRVVVVGGRDRFGRVHAERWTFAPS